MKWSLEKVWNEAAKSTQRPLVPRDYIYASELMYPKVDRFLKMRAVPYTTPPNDRSLRKFFCGRVWEYIVKNVLLTCGLYINEEVKADCTPYNSSLPIHGRLDFLCGGKVNKEEAMENAAAHHLPEFLMGIAENIVSFYDGKDLERRVVELKSVSMYAFEYVEKRGKALDTHTAQGYHYSRHAELPAVVDYISKDTSLLAEFDINDDTEAAYKDDIEQMSFYFLKGEMPPVEPLSMFDPSVAKFSKHLGVEYSPYLSMLYGFANPDEYRRAVEPVVKRWNNALTRYAAAEMGATTPTGKPIVISQKNKDVRQEIMLAGYNFSELLRVKVEMQEVEVEDE